MMELLLRQLSWTDGISLVVGTIIGSGIFSSPGAVVRHTHSGGAAMVVWACSGLLTFFGALIYVELGSRFPSAGGELTYLKHGFPAFHGLFSFLFMWTSVFMTRPLSATIICSVFGNYCVRFLNQTFQISLNGMFVQLAALSCATLTCVLLAVSTRAATFVMNITTSLKCLALLLVAILGFLPRERQQISFDNTAITVLDYPQAFLLCLWAFDGWNSLVYASEELVQPQVMVRIIYVSMPLITVLYLVANFAYLSVLPLDVIQQSETIGLDFIRTTFPELEFVLVLCICISTFGAAIGTLFTSSRLVYSASENGQLPRSFRTLSSNGTPIVALLFQFILVLLFLFSGDFEFLVDLFGCVAWLFYFLTVLGLVCIRYREKIVDEHTYRAPWVAIVCFLLTSCILVITAVMANPLNGLIGIVFMGCGLPLWGVWWWKQSPQKVSEQEGEEEGVILL